MNAMSWTGGINFDIVVCFGCAEFNFFSYLRETITDLKQFYNAKLFYARLERSVQIVTPR